MLCACGCPWESKEQRYFEELVPVRINVATVKAAKNDGKDGKNVMNPSDGHASHAFHPSHAPEPLLPPRGDYETKHQDCGITYPSSGHRTPQVLR